jgi:hypothetical protein
MSGQPTRGPVFLEMDRWSYMLHWAWMHGLIPLIEIGTSMTSLRMDSLHGFSGLW